MLKPQQERFQVHAFAAAVTLCHILMGLALSGLPFPATAETAILPAVEAAIESCGDSPKSVKSRLETLAAAGFTLTSDSRQARELRFMLSVYPGWSSIDPDDLLRGLVFARDQKARDPKPFAFGSALDPAAILLLLETEGAIYFQLESVVAPISFALSVGEVPSTLTEDYGFGCHFTLPDPVPEDFVDRLIPTGSRIVRDRTNPEEARKFREFRVFDYAGRSTTLEFIDMTQFPDFIALPARAGSNARVSAMLRLDVSPIPLDDSKSRFRKVTP